MNELLVWWFMWVNSNYDVLIMSITLLVVGGLVLEVIRLNKRMNYLNADMYRHVGEQMSLLQEDQVKVNRHVTEDIAKLKKKVDVYLVNYLVNKACEDLPIKRKSIRK